MFILRKCGIRPIRGAVFFTINQLEYSCPIGVNATRRLRTSIAINILYRVWVIKRKEAVLEPEDRTIPIVYVFRLSWL